MRHFAILLVCALIGCAATPRTASMPAPNRTEAALRATLHTGWNDIPGRSGTGCASDSAYKLIVRPGAPDRVLVFLNGGGACWRAAECDPRGRVTYTTRADSANDPRGGGGIFALENPVNPLREYTMVFIPYCTGDVHLGARTVIYQTVVRPGGDTVPRSFTIRHQGTANVSLALQWVQANMPAPRVIVVAGSSAGAVASPVYAEQFARRFPAARVVQLGDAAGGYHTPATPGLMAGWGATEALRRDPVYHGLDSAAFSFEALYTAASRAAPRVTFAQYNAADDAVQLYFLALLGIRGASLRDYLAVGLREIRAANPAFRSYTAPGQVHTILRSNALYSTSVDGVDFRDWLAALVDGRPVQDIGSSLLPQ
jgi:hypothetical protein